MEEYEEEQYTKKMSTKLGHFLSNVPLCACACACACVYTCACVCACVRAFVRMRVRGAGARAGALHACVFSGGRGVASRANTVSPFVKFVLFI